MVVRRKARPDAQDLPFDLRALQVFEAVCTTGSMTAAARRFGMTQPAVSHTIGELERSLGVGLIDRRLRPLGLTPAGAALRRRAERILEEAFQTVPAVLKSARTKLPHVRLGIVHSLAASLGPSFVQDLSTVAAQTVVLSDLASGLGEGLLRRQIDIIVSCDDLRDVDGLERHPILAEPFILIAPKGHEAAGRDGHAALARDLPMLRELPMLRYSARSQTGLMIERHMRRLGLDLPRQLEFDLSSVLVAACSQGQGWALTTPFCLHEARVNPDAIVALPLAPPGFSRRITLVAHRGELGDLPRAMAERARSVVQERLIPELRVLVPWLDAAMTLPDA
jgi:DNA-binding transcriptional LysR family regulator